jgi:hypothetical protein
MTLAGSGRGTAKEESSDAFEGRAPAGSGGPSRAASGCCRRIRRSRSTEARAPIQRGREPSGFGRTSVPKKTPKASVLVARSNGGKRTRGPRVAPPGDSGTRSSIHLSPGRSYGTCLSGSGPAERYGGSSSRRGRGAGGADSDFIVAELRGGNRVEPVEEIIERRTSLEARTYPVEQIPVCSPDNGTPTAGSL